MKPLHHPRLDEIPLSTLLYALGDPVRLEIVRNLALRGELSCSQSCATFQLSKSTLSHHYRILREAGLVMGRKEGTLVVNWLRDDEVNARFPGVLEAVLRAAQARRRGRPLRSVTAAT